MILLAPASSAYQSEGNMLIYAAVESISSSFKGVLSQYHSKSLRIERMANPLEDVGNSVGYGWFAGRRDTVRWR